MLLPEKLVAFTPGRQSLTGVGELVKRPSTIVVIRMTSARYSVSSLA